MRGQRLFYNKVYVDSNSGYNHLAFVCLHSIALENSRYHFQPLAGSGMILVEWD